MLFLYQGPERHLQSVRRCFEWLGVSFCCEGWHLKKWGVRYMSGATEDSAVNASHVPNLRFRLGPSAQAPWPPSKVESHVPGGSRCCWSESLETPSMS